MVNGHYMMHDFYGSRRKFDWSIILFICCVLGCFLLGFYFLHISGNSYQESFLQQRAFNEPLYSFRRAPRYFKQMTSIKWWKFTRNFTNWTLSSNCQTCKHEYRNQIANSSKRDLILGIQVGGVKNLMTFIRTLRGTGCEATVILFVDTSFINKSTSFEKQMLKDCGIQLINMGKMHMPYRKFLFESRHLIYNEFLKKYRKVFDRVIIIDIADTVFQIDPFTQEFGYYTLDFSTEGYLLNSDPENNTLWISIADPNYQKHKIIYDDKYPLNFGLFYGSIDAILHFYNIFLKCKIYTDFKVNTIDQGYLNFLFYNGFFEKHNINIHLTKPGDYLVSMRGYTTVPDSNYPEMYTFKHKPTIPAILHQYNRQETLLNHVISSCPKLGEFDQDPFPSVKT